MGFTAGTRHPCYWTRQSWHFICNRQRATGRREQAQEEMDFLVQLVQSQPCAFPALLQPFLTPVLSGAPLSWGCCHGSVWCLCPRRTAASAFQPWHSQELGTGAEHRLGSTKHVLIYTQIILPGLGVTWLSAASRGLPCQQQVMARRVSQDRARRGAAEQMAAGK